MMTDVMSRVSDPVVKMKRTTIVEPGKSGEAVWASDSVTKTQIGLVNTLRTFRIAFNAKTSRKMRGILKSIVRAAGLASLFLVNT